ncbi:hypothetical protein [Pedobacter endophyticus]|uniref:Uncharacterized protein n=1 Tax=Pedobacter endophyticus TaxID=2789740 RepID=A0A7S9KZI8_9SPHI|nr:hypothetical protein [Pedobacter endophyticus]QPH39371.1 hypothetical protein IZT61_20395 [Pedobacter endophyticus]
MENNKDKEQGKVIENELLDNKVEDVREHDSLDNNKSSKQGTTLFEKDKDRKNNPLGPGHEPGTTPGSSI